MEKVCGLEVEAGREHTRHEARTGHRRAAGNVRRAHPFRAITARGCVAGGSGQLRGNVNARRNRLRHRFQNHAHLSEREQFTHGQQREIRKHRDHAMMPGAMPWIVDGLIVIVVVLRVTIGVFRPMMMRQVFAKNLVPIPGCEQQGRDEQQQWIGKKSAHQTRL